MTVLDELLQESVTYVLDHYVVPANDAEIVEGSDNDSDAVWDRALNEILGPFAGWDVFYMDEIDGDMWVQNLANSGDKEATETHLRFWRRQERTLDAHGELRSMCMAWAERHPTEYPDSATPVSIAFEAFQSEWDRLAREGIDAPANAYHVVGHYLSNVQGGLGTTIDDLRSAADISYADDIEEGLE
jgi:hypothetical protein